MATTTNLNSLVINYLTQAQYDEAAANNTLNENQLYLTPTGITAADISRWNAKSDTDEKVKQSRYNLINENRSILVSSVNLDGEGETVTAETYGCSYLVFNNYSQTLKITGSAGQGALSLASDKISYKKSNYSTSILFANQTADTTLTLPNKTGTIALTSDVSKTQLIRWTEV